jgi:4-amino-4-deoxy-L-arabinose transferase-like glycosyltransferase
LLTSIVALRVLIFSVLPLLVAAAQVGLDKSVRNRERQLEVYLIYLFGLGVAAGGIGGFFGHFFISDVVAESIGWPSGSPFQLEVGFANLALGVLGAIAMGRRDGFREATVIAVSVFGVGATIVHVMDIVQTGNLAPGNTLQNASNLLKPALLMGFLASSRRAERSADTEVCTPEFESWREPRVKAAGALTGCVATGFGLGFAVGQPAIGTALGILIGTGLVAYVVTRHTIQLFAAQGKLPHK